MFSRCFYFLWYVNYSLWGWFFYELDRSQIFSILYLQALQISKTKHMFIWKYSFENWWYLLMIFPLNEAAPSQPASCNQPLWRHYEVISTKFRPSYFNPGNVLYLTAILSTSNRIGGKRFKNDLWRHYDVISTKFRTPYFNPSNALYVPAKFRGPIRIGSKCF